MRQNVESDSQQPPAEPTKEESRPSEGLAGSTNEVEQEIKYKKISSFRQIYLMVKKNFLITFRKTNFMMFHLVTLTLISVIIVLINYITNTALKNQGDLIYPMNEVLPIQKCSFADNCKSFGYIMIGTPEPWIDFTLAEISTKAKLDPKTDMVEIYKGNDFQYVLKNFKSLTPYSYGAIVVFCTTEVIYSGIAIPCKDLTSKTYWILYNQTLVKQSMMENMNIPLKFSDDAVRAARMMENAISTWILRNDYNMTDAVVEHNYTTQDYPRVAAEGSDEFDSSSQQGPFWFFIPILISFLTMNTIVINEKEKRLRQGLMIFGVGSVPYWLSWIIFIALFDLLFGGLLALSGYICQFRVFLNSPYLVMLAMFWCSLFGLHMQGLVIASMVSSSNNGAKYGYSLMLISVFFLIIFSRNDFLSFFFIDSENFLVLFVNTVLGLLPSFHYCIGIMNIISVAGITIDSETGTTNPGRDYSYTDFVTKVKGNIYGKEFFMPSPGSSCLSILYDFLFFVVLIWLCDNLIDSNKGFARNPLYFLFKLCKSKKSEKKLALYKAEQSERDIDEVDQEFNRMSKAIDKDKNQILIRDARSANGIVVQNISKNYEFAPWLRCCCRKRTKNSLYNVNLEVREGELFGMLGPNGAGKTTLIGIVSGIMSFSEGSFFSAGYNSDIELKQIRDVTNVCPQFDILWEELTVEEHILMYSEFKGMIIPDMNKFAVDLMSEVNLGKQVKDLVTNLSGGMRRRTSIALSTLGCPKILVFDEPTTGLDPANRRNIWTFINKLKKKKRTILLTTHILEEADILSDRLCVISLGKIKVVGTSSDLKKNVGAGFKINIIINTKDEESKKKLNDYMFEHLPESVFSDDINMTQIYELEGSLTKKLIAFLKHFESDTEIRTLIRDIFVANISLEEVFMDAVKDEKHLKEANLDEMIRGKYRDTVANKKPTTNLMTEVQETSNPETGKRKEN
jgi:ABC-type multidrug transport system ATPase subunit